MEETRLFAPRMGLWADARTVIMLLHRRLSHPVADHALLILQLLSPDSLHLEAFYPAQRVGMALPIRARSNVREEAIEDRKMSGLRKAATPWSGRVCGSPTSPLRTRSERNQSSSFPSVT